MALDFVQFIAGSLSLPAHKVKNTLQLLEGGATVPFIARYRKEATGSLDETEIHAIQKESKRIGDLEKRKEVILASIDEQGKMTPDLKKRIESCFNLTELEDIYLPYRPKRRTKATIAKEKGLEPLAQALFAQDRHDLNRLAQPFIGGEVADVEDALQGARDIIAEWVNEDEKARNRTRQVFSKEAVIRSKVARGKEEEGSKYRDYFDFSEPLAKCPSHRLLAIRRGEDEGFLRVVIEPDEEAALPGLTKLFVKGFGDASDQVRTAVQDAYQRLLAPSIETEFRHSSKEKADLEAINVFTVNLRQLLLAPPLGQKRVLGIDPGFRTGCKIVCLDENGHLLHNDTIYPHPPQNEDFIAKRVLADLVEKYRIDAIAVGNGTAGRETQDVCKAAEFGRKVEIFMVNEAGASIYSASEVAREEFPDYDVTVRGAVSIGRRLVDPLAELVKIDPKSIGVGQYQHDVNQPLLKENLDKVVESCVNSVGINVNTASKELLTYVSGLGPVLAANIVTFRKENGTFKSREALKKVPRMGDKSFEQCAGFLRIRDGKNPLDNTAVHPERYHLVAQMAADLGVGVEELIRNPKLVKQIDLRRYTDEQVGLPTLNDIVREMEKPGLDPRGEAKAFEFAAVRSIDDLRPGMVLPGIVNNITNFGAFVDIGVKESGLVHVSQLANRFVKNPADVVKLHQAVTVRILEIDYQRKRIQLTMKDVN
ncbi:MAG: RNA-binding transcriptional accessory protein [Lewinellaceae bacterium]|nr:RNA-binding transcriptional accessory protein [Lewinella sp.]MCB9279174.1 RNA-binding transcriptional accessory protein [Lewinellaceae bacterium]